MAQDQAGHKNPKRESSAAGPIGSCNQAGRHSVTKIRQLVHHALAAWLAAAVVSGAAQAQEKRGPVTNLPLPRFVSLKASEGNVRRGPSLTHRIDWVFKRRDMPLEVTAEFGHWRRVQDHDGAGGWVHYALISGARTVLIEQDMTPVYARPDTSAPIAAAFELGVVARLGTCTLVWCKVSAGGFRGWVEKEKLWGVMPDELRD